MALELQALFRAKIFWLDSVPLKKGDSCSIKVATMETTIIVQEIEKIISIGDLSYEHKDLIERHEIAEVVFRLNKRIAIDDSGLIYNTGRFGLFSSSQLVGGGTISMDGYADQRGVDIKRATNIHLLEHRVSIEERFKTKVDPEEDESVQPNKNKQKTEAERRELRIDRPDDQSYNATNVPAYALPSQRLLGTDRPSCYSEIQYLSNY